MNYEGLLGILSKLMYELSATPRRRNMLFTLQMTRQGEKDHFIQIHLQAITGIFPYRSKSTFELGIK